MKYLVIIKEKLSLLWPMWILIMSVAIWSVAVQDGHINRDGFLYLKQAYLISEGNWKEGLAVYRWPYFSILIAFFYKITDLHLQVVAHGVNLMLFGITALFYLKILKLIYLQKYIIFYGGIILLSFIPIMDDYVGMILRDHGLWAGCMAGTYFYLKYISNDKLFNNFLWQISFAFAGLFRPEAFVFLFLIPLFHLFFQKKQKSKWLNIQQFLHHYLVTFTCLFFILINKFILNLNLLISDKSNRLNEFIPALMSFFKQISSPLPIFTDHQYLNLLLQNNPVMIAIIFLLSLFLIKTIKGLGVLNLILIYKYFCNPQKASRAKLSPLYFLIFINLCLVFVVFINNYVLTDRYLVLSYFWILIILTPELYLLFESKSYNKNKILNSLIITLIVILVLNVLIDNKHKREKKQIDEFLIKMQTDYNETIN
jgi:hypothetical protein